jgi:hypothetical protein
LDETATNSVRKSVWFKLSAVGFITLIVLIHIYAYYFTIGAHAPYWVDFGLVGVVVVQLFFGAVLVVKVVVNRLRRSETPSD